MASEAEVPATEELRPQYERVEKKSQVWKYIYKLTNGPEPNRRGTMCSYVCKICADNPKLPFQDALIAIHNDNTSNGTSHLKSHHSAIHQSLFLSPGRSRASTPPGAVKRERKVTRKESLGLVKRPSPSEQQQGGFKRILVTGGAGFLGLHLCKRLLDMGHDVICLDNLFTSQKIGMRELQKYDNFEFVRHDITNPYHAEVDEIYNLACPASPVHYQYNPIQTTKVCLLLAYPHKSNVQ
ncbi:UDP-glucuronic acid decarboxylase 1 [Achlya hypogyna]|uniref:UDP-glucuronate decarboxylase n=1 Tax=Achlya hypogyna TaxID=1202772 RepID=A0A1V9YRX1_ACHHY|nr:UDP-glucuronic acid decarboxylase 1 [Achlya hypogyna]